MFGPALAVYMTAAKPANLTGIEVYDSNALDQHLRSPGYDKARIEMLLDSGAVSAS